MLPPTPNLPVHTPYPCANMLVTHKPLLGCKHDCCAWSGVLAHILLPASRLHSGEREPSACCLQEGLAPALKTAPALQALMLREDRVRIEQPAQPLWWALLWLMLKYYLLVLFLMKLDGPLEWAW